MSKAERGVRVNLAKVLSTIDCFEDKLKNDKSLIEADPVLSEEERQIILNDYRAAISGKRQGIRVLSAIIEQQKARNRLDRCQRLEECKATAIQELQSVLSEFLGLLDDYLITSSDDNVKAQIFYMKAKGDFLRYQCECCKEDERSRIASKAQDCYKSAMKLQSENSSGQSAMSLVLALNYSILLYEVMDNKNDAIELAQKTLDQSSVLAKEGMEEQFSEIASIQQMLRKNLTSWSREEE